MTLAYGSSVWYVSNIIEKYDKPKYKIPAEWRFMNVPDKLVAWKQRKNQTRQYHTTRGSMRTPTFHCHRDGSKTAHVVESNDTETARAIDWNSSSGSSSTMSSVSLLQQLSNNGPNRRRARSRTRDASGF